MGHRSLGRRRDPEIDRAIIEAALDEVAELGYPTASVAGIARRAQVPRSTVYRRWPSKEDLVIAAVADVDMKIRANPTGDARQDLYDEVFNLYARWRDARSAAVMTSIICDAARSGGPSSAWHDRLIEPYRARIAVILDRGVASGQFRQDLDTGLVIDLLIALPLQEHLHLSQCELPDIRSRVDRFMAGVFDRLAH